MQFFFGSFLLEYSWFLFSSTFCFFYFLFLFGLKLDAFIKCLVEQQEKALRKSEVCSLLASV